MAAVHERVHAVRDSTAHTLGAQCMMLEEDRWCSLATLTVHRFQT